MSGQSFADYAKLEPRLLDLEKQSKAMESYPQSKRFCAHSVWYGFFKPALTHFIGHHRYDRSGDVSLFTADAYDTVHAHLYDPLPPCNHDGGMCWSLKHDPEHDRILEFLDKAGGDL